MLRTSRAFLPVLLLAACQALPTAPLASQASRAASAVAQPGSVDTKAAVAGGVVPDEAAQPEAAWLSASEGELLVRVRWPESGRAVQLLPRSTDRLDLVLSTSAGVERGRALLLRQPGVAVAEATMSARTGTNLVLEAEARDGDGVVVARGRTEGITTAPHVRTPVSLLLEPLFRPVLTRLRPAVAGPGAKLVLEGSFPVTASRSVSVSFTGAAEQVAKAATDALEVTVPEGTTEGTVTVRVDGVPNLQALSFRPLSSVGFVATGDMRPWPIDGRLYGWSGGEFPFAPTGVVGSGSPEWLPSEAARVELTGEGASPDGVWRPVTSSDGLLTVTSGRLVATGDLRVGFAAPPLWSMATGSSQADRGVMLVDTAEGWLAAWEPLAFSGAQTIALQPIAADGRQGQTVAYVIDTSPGEQAMALARVGPYVVLATRTPESVATGSVTIGLLDPDGRQPTGVEDRTVRISREGEDLRLGTVMVRGTRVLLVCLARAGLSWRLRTHAFETAGGRLAFLGSGGFGFSDGSGMNFDAPSSERIAAVPWGAGYLLWAYGTAASAGSGQRMIVRALVDAAGSVVATNVLGVTSGPRLPAMAPRPDGGAWLVSVAPGSGEYQLHVRGFAHPGGLPADLEPDAPQASESMRFGDLPGPIPLIGVGDALVDPIQHTPSIVPFGEALLVGATIRRPDGKGYRPVVVWVRAKRVDAGSLTLVVSQVQPLADEGNATRLAQDASGVRAIWRTAQGEVRTCRVVIPE